MKPRVFSLHVNHHHIEVTAQANTPLLYILRNDLRLNGPKFGCGYGECGACAVLLNGKAIRSCVTPLGAIGNGEIITLEGLSKDDQCHPVQQAFIEKNAAQCGYCLNGMIIAITALGLSISNNSEQAPIDDAAIKKALRHHLCRCGTHVEILQAAKLALENMQNHTSRDIDLKEDNNQIKA